MHTLQSHEKQTNLIWRRHRFMIKLVLLIPRKVHLGSPPTVVWLKPNTPLWREFLLKPLQNKRRELFVLQTNLKQNKVSLWELFDYPESNAKPNIKTKEDFANVNF